MATMNFNTANSTFRQLLGNGLSYRVPTFQRDYSWTDDEWDDLWQDIVAMFEEDGELSHYMGYLVLQSADSKVFDIVDGQQRITTISVMILAALAHYQDLLDGGVDSENNHRRSEQFRNSYIGYLDPVSLVPRSKLELNRHNNKFYQNYLVPLDKLPQRGLNASEHQLRKAFQWFKTRIKERFKLEPSSGKDLASFLDNLVDKLFFTVITVTDELNAFKVFETLNARGVRLSATDLLKNYLFSIVSKEKTHETELKSIEDKWENIVGQLGSEGFPEFLRVFWNSRYKLVRKAELFKTIRNKITDRRLVFALLRDLDQSAEVYSALKEADGSEWNQDESKSLRQLSMYSVRQPMALLLACHTKYYESSRNDFTRILKAIAVISLRYNVISGLPPNEQERLYNNVAQKVSNGESANAADVIAYLQDLYPDDEQFKVAFKKKELRTTSSRNKKIVRYILFELERQISGNDFDFESASYNLEHILPEHPSNDWDNIDDSKLENLVYRLGNMTMLDSKQNRIIGNADYAKKRAVYEESEFGITRAIAKHYDSWDENKINSRQSVMADVAAGIWKI
jgi:uncharacterized protein with ParB-like and HNH nuclease domain